MSFLISVCSSVPWYETFGIFMVNTNCMIMLTSIENRISHM